MLLHFNEQKNKENLNGFFQLLTYTNHRNILIILSNVQINL